MATRTTLAVAALLLATCTMTLADGRYGVDVSQPASEASFKCMKDEHAVSFVIIRSYTELGDSDTAVVGTAKAARAAGVNVGVCTYWPRCCSKYLVATPLTIAAYPGHARPRSLP